MLRVHMDVTKRQETLSVRVMHTEAWVGGLQCMQVPEGECQGRVRVQCMQRRGHPKEETW